MFVTFCPKKYVKYYNKIYRIPFMTLAVSVDSASKTQLNHAVS